jgi:polyferredoxin
VKVCPVGIDIRRGTQLECIHCTLCIDACDNIMDKLKRPHGLIKYASENGEKHKVLTPRSIVYSAVSVVLLGVLLFSLSASTKLNLVFLRAKVPFTVARDGRIMNNFQLKLSHQGSERAKVEFRIKESDLAGKIELITPSHPTVIDEAEKKIIFFFRFHPELLVGGQRKVTVQVEDVASKTVLTEKEVSLVGPVQ